jgi:hypothetical protein
MPFFSQSSDCATISQKELARRIKVKVRGALRRQNRSAMRESKSRTFIVPFSFIFQSLKIPQIFAVQFGLVQLGGWNG